MNNLDWRSKAILTGGMVGAAFGMAAAYMYVNSVEKVAQERGERPQFNPAEAATIGLTALGILRQIASLPEDKKNKKRK